MIRHKHTHTRSSLISHSHLYLIMSCHEALWISKNDIGYMIEKWLRLKQLESEFFFFPISILFIYFLQFLKHKGPSTIRGSTHGFDMVDSFIDQLLCVFPVGRILWHCLQRRQDLWVENPQTLTGKKSNVQWRVFLLVHCFIVILKNIISPWKKFTGKIWVWHPWIGAYTKESPWLHTCYGVMRTQTHLMWIVRHCQANKACRLKEKEGRWNA